jgi:hypothetical protein
VRQNQKNLTEQKKTLDKVQIAIYLHLHLITPDLPADVHGNHLAGSG